MTEGRDAGDGVGEELARARAALGLSIADVAQQLKFASRQIEALEQGRFEELPTGTFARGMVRSYARLLKLDAEALVQRIAERVATPDNAAAVASVRRPIPITDSARRTNLVYATLSIAILIVIAGVAFEWQRERSGPGQLSFVATEAAPVQPAPAQVEPQRTALATTSTTPTLAPLAPEPAAAVPPPAKTATADARVSSSTSAGTKRIAMKFERASWVEIRGRDGKILTSQLNAGGTEQTVEGKPPFTLIVGNAQHVRMSYDDRPIDLAPHVKVEVARFTLD